MSQPTPPPHEPPQVDGPSLGSWAGSAPGAGPPPPSGPRRWWWYVLIALGILGAIVVSLAVVALILSVIAGIVALIVFGIILYSCSHK